MNITIVRTFVMLRKMASNYQVVTKKLEQMEQEYKGKFKEIYKALNYLLNPQVNPGKPLGFNYKKKK